MDNIKVVALDDLIGLHWLSACDLSIERVESFCGGENAHVIRFTLDGITYTAIENPIDSYRSAMDSIHTSRADRLQNSFTPIQVLVRKQDQESYHNDDIIEMIDVINGKVVLRVGTHAFEDYYPCFVGEFRPHNLSCNAQVASLGL